MTSPPKQDLVGKANGLLTTFEHLLIQSAATHYGSSVPPASAHTFSQAYHVFVAAFSAWKAHDADTLVKTMLAQYVELDLIWQTVKSEGEEVVKTEYRDGIRENQILLLARIKRLVGPDQAKIMIRDAIRDARATRINRRATTKHARSTTTLPPSTGLPHTTDDDPPSDEVLSSSLRSVRASVPHSAADPDAVEELMRVMSIVPDNRTLVHELALNKDYRIEPDTGAQAERRRTLQRATLDEMRRDVEQGRAERWIVAMTVHIRTRLLRLLTPGNSLHVLISEALDPAVIGRECAMGSFSYEKFFGFMLSILPRLCAPFRDPDVAALAATDADEDVIDRLARLMHVIDLLSLDYANFLLQESAPRIVSDAPAYEERCFAHDLENGVVSLQGTERWWKHAREAVQAEVNHRDPKAVNHPTNRPTARRIYAHALTDLFIATSEVDDEAVPETLWLDRGRIRAGRADAVGIVTVGAILLSAKNLLKRDVRSPWKGEASRIWDIISDDDGRGQFESETEEGPMQILSAIESAHTLPPAVKVQLGQLVRRFVSHRRSRSWTDPVMRLLLHRLRTHVLSRLLSSSSSSSSLSSSSASHGGGGGSGSGGPNHRHHDRNSSGTGQESLVASGMVEFLSRINDLVDEVRRVGEVDRASHERWYEQVMTSSTSSTSTSTQSSSTSTTPTTTTISTSTTTTTTKEDGW